MDQMNLWSVIDEDGEERAVTREDLLRIAGVLKKTFRFDNKAEFDKRVDKGADLSDIDGIGPVFSQIVPVFHSLSPALWEDLMGLPYGPESAEGQGEALIAPPQKDGEQAETRLVLPDS